MSIIFKDYYTNLPNNHRIAGFDLDHTIIKPKSGNVFPKDNDDWMLLYSCIKYKLLQLTDNHIIVFFSNQKNVEDDFITKIDKLQILLEVEFIFIAAKANDIYRKPNIGMFRHIENYLKHKNIKINDLRSNSFYVGDMAGRKDDKMDTDYKFALNLKIDFYTPEEFFLGAPKQELNLGGYLLNYTHKNPALDIMPENNTLVVISGYPGSGKTYLAKSLDGFAHISRDIYGSKFNKKLQEALEKNLPIVVEGMYGTNKTRHDLKDFISTYSKTKYNTIYIRMSTSFELSYHMNIFRSLDGMRQRIPEVAYLKYRKDYEEVISSDWDTLIECHMNVPPEANKYYLF